MAAAAIGRAGGRGGRENMWASGSDAQCGRQAARGGRRVLGGGIQPCSSDILFYSLTDIIGSRSCLILFAAEKVFLALMESMV